MSNLTPQEEQDLAVLRFRLRVVIGVIFGALIGVGLHVALNSDLHCSEADSGVCSALIWVVLVPLGLITLAPLWMPYLKLTYFASPWHLAFNAFFSESISLVIGLSINAAIVGGLIAYFTGKRKLRKH